MGILPEGFSHQFRVETPQISLLGDCAILPDGYRPSDSADDDCELSASDQAIVDEAMGKGSIPPPGFTTGQLLSPASTVTTSDTTRAPNVS